LIYHTANGVPYLREPEVAVVSRTHAMIDNALPFLKSYDLEYEDYVHDLPLESTAEVCKFAGQLDYLSFGEKRTPNREAQKYLDRIKSERHGNVLEHASFGVLCWGISRSCTHEIVRHRAGYSYSQVSQRYVGSSTIRFVQRPELRATPELHHDFETLIDDAFAMYVGTCTRLANLYKGSLAGTELLKHVRQSARDLLPNCTEAPILITANVRAWRHFLEQRASPHAETAIRALAIAIYRQLMEYAPLLFSDYKQHKLDDDTEYLSTSWSKV
jgi:thymidylate synthase (FAD)